MPERVQLSRKKGWRMPANTVKVDRTTRWGNPCDWREWLENAPREVLYYADERKRWAKAQAVDSFEEELRSGRILLPLELLRGKNLACWCHPADRCHADVLLALANQATCTAPTEPLNPEGGNNER